MICFCLILWHFPIPAVDANRSSLWFRFESKSEVSSCQFTNWRFQHGQLDPSCFLVGSDINWSPRFSIKKNILLINSRQIDNQTDGISNRFKHIQRLRFACEFQSRVVNLVNMVNMKSLQGTILSRDSQNENDTQVDSPNGLKPIQSGFLLQSTQNTPENKPHAKFPRRKAVDSFQTVRVSAV